MKNLFTFVNDNGLFRVGLRPFDREMAKVLLMSAIRNWVNACQIQIIDPQVNINRHPSLPPHTLYIDPDGRKFIKIVSRQGESHGGVWAFVATQDGNTKAMGSYKAGDIFKPATWQQPAKHARGNIYENLPLCNIRQWTGPDYLR